MDCTRARTELGWTPAVGAADEIAELLAGLRAEAGMPTAPLASSGWAGRLHELRTGVGGRP